MSFLDKVTSMLQDSSIIEKAVTAAFSKFDKDASGFIEQGEIMGVLEHVTGLLGIQHKLPTAAIDKVFGKAAGTDGKVDQAEFTTLIRSVLHMTKESPEALAA
ncbi:MAG: hypothetical protein J3K34DRAFT_430604 [Monoraphidium minutum]|nr:MAG: hypothetical protein J3K34DRAFT_430604 [Monoraphidium minutum]